MDSMVERVAHAMWRDVPQRTKCPRPAGWTFENEPEDLQEAYRSDARTVIAAMREPTDTMIRSGYLATDWGYAIDTDEKAAKEMLETWQVMIDEALKP